MQVQAIAAFGEPDVFYPLELPKPEVIPGYVVIQVAASSINPVDCKIRRFGPSIAPALPAVLHSDVAGVITAVGAGVGKFQVGDQVYACAGGVKGLGGALADFLLADADLVAFKPKSLTLLQAAALPLVAITAWEALFDRGALQPGQTVLIHAATGGVGHIAIQLAKWAGAKVFTTVSSAEKGAIAQQLGADVVINYREKSVEEYVEEHTNGQGFDLVFDTVGKGNLDISFAAAKLKGTVVSISTNSTHDLSLMHSKSLTLHVVFMLIPMLHNLGRARHGEILTDLAQLVDKDLVKPLIDPQSFSFDQVSLAHSYWESGKAIGKIVLENNNYSNN